ncbi:cytochrome P450 [Punctularia strigosozonata HHB-11173 SS5]|uniref:cytochrome P450 n=1 Tax=Punctularia strigosozonata (strain HHB-11173) TaxID=741275 RepID=UPI00044176F0|nr:cytochrome P450 [Punctularia strigosozonata HHB-11173 SS5]EIN10755.1 cytochrome P450 [Punctularia strigosozonata HHB-11173 SS5]
MAQLFDSVPTDVKIGTALLLLAAAGTKLISNSQSLPLPPGPQGHWLFGATFSSSEAWRVLEEWTQEYGPVFSYRQGTRRMFIIGRTQAAIDILEREGAATLDRPLNIPAETASGGLRILNMSWSDQARKLRRAMHEHLRHKVALSYGDMQEEHARNVILDILKNPEDHQTHVRRFSAATTLRLAYGKTTPTYVDDLEIQRINVIVARLRKILFPGSLWVDRIPLLRYIPGWLREQQEWHHNELDLYHSQVNTVKAQIAQGDAPQSFVKYLLEDQEKLGLSNDELAYLAGSLFNAGSESTAAVLGWVIVAAAKHPAAQVQVQAELDRIVGLQRAPTFDDENGLPQVTAFMREVYRWRPASTIAQAHRSRKDIIWKNYLIPAGSTIIGSQWSIAHDPEVWPNPDRFDPNRWLYEDGGLREDKKTFMFGFGRRFCPGQHFANRAVFINTALLLWSYNIREDPAHPIDSMAFSKSSLIHPQPFKVQFGPRVANLGSLLAERP